MKIIAERQDLGGGLIVSSLFAVDCRGAIDKLVTNFLLEFVSELTLNDLSSLEDIVSGGVQFDDGDNALVEINGKTAWLRVRSGSPAGLLVENEYAPEYSDENRVPKVFNLGLVRASLSVWRQLREAERDLGREGSVGSRFEVVVGGKSPGG